MIKQKCNHCQKDITVEKSGCPQYCEECEYERQKFLEKWAKINGKQILIITKMGMGIRISLSDFPVQKRGGIGIKAMKLRENDKVIGVLQYDCY